MPPQSFTLAGGALANVRQSSHKAEHAGVTLSWYDGSPPPRILDQLQALSQIWLTETFGKGAIEMGFSLGRIREVPAQAACAEAIATSQTPPKGEVLPRLITGVACDRAGQTCAFVTCTPIYGTVETSSRAPEPSQQRRGWGWAMDMMRRKPDAPYGAIDLLIERTIERCHTSKADVLSLGLIALADHRQEMIPIERELTQCLSPLSIC